MIYGHCSEKAPREPDTQMIIRVRLNGLSEKSLILARRDLLSWLMSAGLTCSEHIDFFFPC